MWWAGSAAAQEDDEDSAGSSGGFSGTSRSSVQAGDIKLAVRRIGVGDRVRPGDWAGYQVEVTEESTKSRTVWIQLELPDADGDTATYVRVVSTTPGQARSLWLTGWQPRGQIPGFNYRFSVFEAVPRDEPAGPRNVVDRYTRGRRLLVRVEQANQRHGIDGTQSLIGVVGLTTDGLEQYPAARDTRVGIPPTGHELTELAAGLRPDDLPDVWHALSPFEAIVWTGTGTDFDPAKVQDAQAAAIKQWVRRGGHLVVVMPSVGQSWYGPRAGLNPFADILPVVEPRLMEGIDLNLWRSLFTVSPSVSFGNRANFSMWRLDAAPGAAGPDAMPILAGPGGEPVVVRRLVGAGAVTVVGVDLSRRDFAPRDALRADVFWNRVLGKRLELMSPAELAARQSGRRRGAGNQPQFMADRPPIEFDSVIPDRINKTVSAVKGLLMAFVVFSLYWLLAGPAGYFFLKQRNMRQHGWVAFVAVAGVFTLVGWGGAKILRTGRDADKHLTFIDHVYGRDNTRLRSWMELTLPKYGQQRVSVAAPAVDAAGTPSEWHNTITVWQPSADQKLLGSFPDARPYFVDARFPDAVSYPARATTRQFQVDAAGGLPINWGMPRPIADEKVPVGREVWIEELAQPELPGSDRRWKVHGVLTHDLPGELRDVLLVVVRPLRGRYRPGELPSEIYAKQLLGRGWKPGTPLDIEGELGASKLSELAIGGALAKWRGQPGSGFVGAAMLAQSRRFEDLMYGLAFYPMLTPPEPSAASAFRVIRESAQNWDLGRWCTQPCIMVIGVLGDKTEGAVECPVPVAIDDDPGEAVRKQILGTTVLRWVYPLPAAPPAWTHITHNPEGGDGTEEDKPKDDPPEPDGRG